MAVFKVPVVFSKKGCNASGRILIAAVEHKGSSADTSVVIACYVALERRPTKGRIESAAGEA